MPLERPLLAPSDALVLTGADNAFPGAALAPREPSTSQTGAGAAR